MTSDLGDKRLITPVGAPSIKKCFISAPAGAPLSVLRASLESRGVRVLVPHDLAVGTDWASEVDHDRSSSRRSTTELPA